MGFRFLIFFWGGVVTSAWGAWRVLVGVCGEPWLGAYIERDPWAIWPLGLFLLAASWRWGGVPGLGLGAFYSLGADGGLGGSPSGRAVDGVAALGRAAGVTLSLHRHQWIHRRCRCHRRHLCLRWLSLSRLRCFRPWGCWCRCLGCIHPPP